MFEQIGTVIIVIVVLVVGAGLGLFAGFVLGRHKGQEMARGVKSEELEEAKTSLENARFENAELSARNAAAQAQIEGVNQQLAFAKSQLAQAQQAEQIRIQQERERAAAEAERKRQADAQAAEAKRAEQEARLKEQSKVLEALAPVAKNLDTLQNKVTQDRRGPQEGNGRIGSPTQGAQRSAGPFGQGNQFLVRRVAQQQGAWRVGRGPAQEHCRVRRIAGTCRFRHPGGGHGCRWAYVAPGYDRASAGRQDHSD